MYVSSVFIMDTNMKNLALSDRHYDFFLFFYMYMYIYAEFCENYPKKNEKYNIVQVQFPCDI